MQQTSRSIASGATTRNRADARGSDSNGGATQNSVTDTANEIRQRISPENIKAEVSHYVRSRGEAMLEDITRRASQPDAGRSCGRESRISPA